MEAKTLPYEIKLMEELNHWNGYVGIPPSHPLFGKGYSESICGHAGCYEHTPDNYLDVHGGLTYSEKHKDGLWWFGFDTGHSFDDPRFGGTKKSPHYVRHECYRLAQQLLKWKLPVTE